MATITRRQWLRGAAVTAVCAVPGLGIADQEKPPRARPESKGESAKGQPQQGQPQKSQPVKGQKVNINEASRAELMKLEGVGAGAADRIIAHRDARGPFKRVQDLEKVDKVGRAVLEKNAGRIAVK